MPSVDVVVDCPVFDSFRVQQIAGMFDVPLNEFCTEMFNVELPALEEDWQIGLIVGPSGSGKSSVARKAFPKELYQECDWPADKAVIDCFNEVPVRKVVELFTAVGFSSPPAWVKPYQVLSCGEKFRCDVLYAGNTTKKVVAKTAAGGSSGSASSSISATTGTWHHVIAVFASDTNRSIYLDGENAGTNTDSVSATALDFFYFGNISDANNVEIAEVSIVAAEVTAQQAAILANGCPMLSTSLVRQTIAHQDCIRLINRPGLGPVFSSNGTPGVVTHPRILFAEDETATAMPLRFGGPWQVEQSELHTSTAKIGQSSTAGAVFNNSILSGEVMS